MHLSRFLWRKQKCFRAGSWFYSYALRSEEHTSELQSHLNLEFAGAGASVPLPGFGNTLWKGVKEAVDENGFIGIFMGGFKASAVGISAALIFSYIASIIFQPKMKK